MSSRARDLWDGSSQSQGLIEDRGEGDWPDNASETSDVSALSQSFSKTTIDNIESASAYGDENDFVGVDLPEYACSYCGISDPACVVRCVETKKWYVVAYGSFYITLVQVL